MTLRELLRYEIWSKRTTKKILVVAGIVFAVDELQNPESLSDEEFTVRDNKAESAVDAAERAARTRKDELTHVRLVVCWMGAGLTRIKVVERRLVEQGRFNGTAKSWEQQQESGVFTDAVAHESCLALHKELD